MADRDLYISNGTCYSAPGKKLDASFIPCGNDKYGRQTCCGAGDNCLADNACFGFHGQGYGSSLTYRAGCTDPDYKDASCPEKAFDQPWIALTRCDDVPEDWAPCSQINDPTTLQPGAQCSCTEAAKTTIAFKDASILSSSASLPRSTGESIQFFPGHIPTAPSSMTNGPTSNSADQTSNSAGQTTTNGAGTTAGSSSGSTPGPTGMTTSTRGATDSNGITTGPIQSSTSSPGNSGGNGGGNSGSGDNNSGSGSSGLSDKANIGLGVGIGTGGLLLLVLAAIFLYRRRRRLAAFGGKGDGQRITKTKPGAAGAGIPDPRASEADGNAVSEVDGKPVSKADKASVSEADGQELHEADGRPVSRLSGPATTISELDGTEIPRNSGTHAHGHVQEEPTLSPVAEAPASEKGLGQTPASHGGPSQGRGKLPTPRPITSETVDLVPPPLRIGHDPRLD